MNRGEGLRYAAHAKSGQINLFKEEKKKTKKFGYKNKGQQFSVRKVQTQVDKQPTNASQVSTKKSATTKPAATATKNRKPPTNDQKTKPAPRKDLIKKNAQAVSSGKVKQQPTPTGGGGSTVTLTQDQLNAILATIGKAAGSSEIPNISLENGSIKVDESHNDVPRQSSQKRDTDKPETNNNVVNTSGENPLQSVSKDENESTQGVNTHIPNSHSPSLSKRPVNKEETQLRKSSPGDVQRKPPSRNDGGLPQLHKVQQGGSGTGYGDVSSMIGLNERELAEKKKQQWKKELDEQIALKQQHQGVSSRRRGRNDDSPQQTWDPWGQPQHVRGSRTLNASMNLDLSGVHSAEQSDAFPMSSKSREPMSTRITPRGDVTSSLGKIATQKYTPAAMRSSFIIGGDPMENYVKNVKDQEKKQWLEELERQKRETQERREQDKRKQNEFHDRMSHWAEQVTPRSKSVAQPQQEVKPVTTVDDSVITPTSQSGNQVELSPQRHHSADAVPSKGRNDADESTSHIRPSGLLVDPVEVERKEIARQKHLEHMLAVKAQVEERQRQKREAMEAKKREEAEEERKLAEERDLLQKQFDIEKEKQRKKEEEAAAKQKAMMESVQAAYNEAQQAKHNKRVQRLTEQGHDVDNLRKSWEVKHPSPETSPRQQQPVKHSPVRNSPVRLEPIVTNAYTSPRQDSNPVGHTATNTTQDAMTSPTFDQAVQTDFQFPPVDDVLLERAFDIQREASAGIEYKPEKQNKKKTDKQKKGKVEGVKGQEKSKKLTKGKSQEISDEEAKPKRTTSVKNRPLWGQSSQNKKKVGNTAKDLTGNQKKREERRKKRMEELLALQEQSAPKRLIEKKKASSLPQSRTASVSRAESTNTRQHHDASRPVTEIDVPLKPDQTPSDAWTEDRKEDRQEDRREGRIDSRREDRRYGPPPSPPIHSGDFVPFMRNDEELIEHSIPVSPDSRQRSRARDTPKSDKGRSSSMDKRDPLLHPERLKDTNVRQEKILQQLSNLRQGLMMKQRELEMGLSTPLVM